MQNSKLNFLLILVFISLNCKNATNGVKNKQQQDPAIEQTENAKNQKIKAEFYCWCFLSKEYGKMDSLLQLPGRNCETVNRVRPLDLIKPNLMFYSSSMKKDVSSLSKVIFNQKSSSDTGNYKVDARFLILLRSSNNINDTVCWYGDNEMIVNEKYLFKYSFNILEKIKTVMRINEINCSSESFSE